jgi:isoleucyl-tRNA synthetase
MPYSTGCTTPLSNFEASLNYKDVRDPAGTHLIAHSSSSSSLIKFGLCLLVVVSFPLKTEPDTALLAWTTTPWYANYPLQR